MRQFKANTRYIDRNSNSVVDYLREVSHYPLASAEEEIELSERIRRGGVDGERACERLVQANLRFVISVAKQFQRNTMELMDLISEGNMGLVKAARLYDGTLGNRFISYAIFWIRQSIMASMQKNDSVIRLPKHQRKNLSMYLTLAEKMMQTEQRMPTAQEFAEYAGIDEDVALDIIRASAKVASLDMRLGDEEDSITIADTLSGDFRADYDSDCESRHEDIMYCLDNVITPREKDVIMRYFGIGHQAQSTEEIARAIGLSLERTRQLKAIAVKKLAASKAGQQLRTYLGRCA